MEPIPDEYYILSLSYTDALSMDILEMPVSPYIACLCNIMHKENMQNYVHCRAKTGI